MSHPSPENCATCPVHHAGNLVKLGVDMANFDYVVVDMPKTIVQWTETVLTASHVYLAPVQLDMRSAQHTLRMLRALLHNKSSSNRNRLEPRAA